MANWGDVPASEQAYLDALYDQYEQSIGYAWSPSLDQLHALALAHPTSIQDFAMSAWGMVPGNVQESMPWAQWGVDHTTYNTKIGEYNTALSSLLGPDAIAGGAGASWIQQAFSQGLSSSELQEKITQDAGMQKTYGWLKFGMNYDQLQQQKTQWQTAFGGQGMTDQQAVLQLQYYHAAPSGPTARASGPQPQQQVTTGGESVVR